MVDLGNKLKIAAAGLGIVGMLGGYSYFVSDTVDTVITETEVKRKNGKDNYLVFTEGEVYENVDAWYRFKFSSSDVQNDCMKLKGKEVEIAKYGWRFSPLSWYENIVDVKAR